jgi:hypothetical protein
VLIVGQFITKLLFLQEWKMSVICVDQHNFVFREDDNESCFKGALGRIFRANYAISSIL